MEGGTKLPKDIVSECLNLTYKLYPSLTYQRFLIMLKAPPICQFVLRSSNRLHPIVCLLNAQFWVNSTSYTKRTHFSICPTLQNLPTTFIQSVVILFYGLLHFSLIIHFLDSFLDGFLVAQELMRANSMEVLI